MHFSFSTALTANPDIVVPYFPQKLKTQIFFFLKHQEMKWGRNKSSPPSFGVFPGTWFSKFKQISGSRDTTSGKKKKQQRGKLDFSPANSSLPAVRREARFYTRDNDAYWTLSFRKDRGEGRRINPLWYDSEDDFRAAVSSFGTRETQFPGRELEGISEMVETINMKEGECSTDIVPENIAFGKKKGSRGARVEKDEKNGRISRKLRSRVQRKKKIDDGEKEASSLKEDEAFPTDTERTDGEDDSSFADLDEKSSEGESTCLSRQIHSRKTKQKRAKARVPRSECRIQAMEDMKKARTKMKNGAKGPVTENSTIYNSIAVVKSTFNPQQDFRDSMVEMIRVKGISRREELQELLACYLTLNRDGHHSLIINAFLEVWFELSGGAY